jgi:sec-independent protein translocase protein TatC
LIFGFLSFIFFVLGSMFGYLVIVPIGMKFLIGFGSRFLIPMISVGKYVSFAMSLSFAFGLVFQLPIIVLFLTRIGIITPRILREKRKYAIVIIFIIGAIFTPPDVITQCLMAIPLIVLYELSILFSRILRR